MKSQLNTLRQLQELVLARDEHHQTGDGSRIDSINDAIDAVRRRLSPEVAGHYDRLYKKSHIVIAAMSNGCCAVCGMQVPTAQAQQVKLAQHLAMCSSCGRILFASEPDEARGVPDRSGRDEPKTGISRFSAEELCVPALAAKTKEEAISELAALMEANGFIANADTLASLALERESVLPTSVGGGLAFPHVRGVEGGGLALAMGVSEKGIDWDGEKVQVVFLSAIPMAVSAFYLRLMSGIVQAFSGKGGITVLLGKHDRASLWKALVKAVRNTVK